MYRSGLRPPQRCVSGRRGAPRDGWAGWSPTPAKMARLWGVSRLGPEARRRAQLAADVALRSGCALDESRVRAADFCGDGDKHFLTLFLTNRQGERQIADFWKCHCIELETCCKHEHLVAEFRFGIDENELSEFQHLMILVVLVIGDK